jgi:hypothetical protein
MAALMQPDAERAVPQQALDDLEDVVGGRQLVGIGVIVAQATPAPDPLQLPPLDDRLVCSPQAAADAVPLECGIDDDLRPIQGMAVDGIMIGERSWSGRQGGVSGYTLWHSSTIPAKSRGWV